MTASHSDETGHRHRTTKFLPWLVGCVIHALAVAWIATSVESRTAPFLVFPLAVGVALGVGVVALARWCQIDHRRTLLQGALLAAVMAVIGQHYFSYLHAQEALQVAAARRADALARFPGLAARLTPPEPESFVGFLQSAAERGRALPAGVAIGIGVWLSWLLDGLLVATGAMIVAWFASANSLHPLDEPPRE